MRDKGYVWGPQGDDERKTHSSLVEWEELPEEEKEQNRRAARDIPNKLAEIGYVMMRAAAGQTCEVFPKGKADVERLARMEHRRWMEAKLATDWQWAEETDKDQKLHEALVPWSDLPESQREKDRALIRDIPHVLASVDHTMTERPEEGQRT